MDSEKRVYEKYAKKYHIDTDVLSYDGLKETYDLFRTYLELVDGTGRRIKSFEEFVKQMCIQQYLIDRHPHMGIYERMYAPWNLN